MGQSDLASWIASVWLVSLRIMPVFLLAPPFSLIRAPKLLIMLMALGLAAALVAAMPDRARLPEIDAGVLAIGAVRELFLGFVPVVVLQLLFGSLYLVGRTIDVQAGFGLALLIDPATRNQLPLAGTLFAYVAGASFFALGGHRDLLHFLAASLQAVAVGGAHGSGSLGTLAAYASSASLVALAIGGAAIAALLLCDLVIAMLSRTIPQLNALLLGIQVKAIVMFLVMPVALGASGALFAHLVATAIETMPRLL